MPPELPPIEPPPLCPLPELGIEDGMLDPPPAEPPPLGMLDPPPLDPPPELPEDPPEDPPEGLGIDGAGMLDDEEDWSTQPPTRNTDVALTNAV